MTHEGCFDKFTGLVVAFGLITLMILDANGLGSKTQVLELTSEMQRVNRLFGVIGLLIGVSMLVGILFIYLYPSREEKK